ncbi:Midasin [Wickerhamomyces ciferrii]|uniref:Midasin n=1 Tax=Wickerhamomyces ciferrii (strain ATCC 14091 / BCRC 22168 / CBS 111 / JCM 3599 / NBRC 0793 / NRRL Y-1031 F-60-10) TaxID=1206466 RepID=K0KGF8_WICCF|nr:Midasin [Wickerhamomyces ciferrii]CCH40529.1 Midasin [Wickerhamomyces ciferrii]
MTTEKEPELDHSNNNTRNGGSNREVTNTLTNEERSRSIVSDESSDLSDLDSIAETEKMYGGESQLKKLSKREDDTTLHEEEEEGEETTVVKEDYIDQLAEDKDEDIDIESQDVGSVVEKLKNSEEPNDLKLNGIGNGNGNGNGSGNEDGKKRKLSNGSNDVFKRRKTEEQEEKEEESQPRKTTSNEPEPDDQDNQDIKIEVNGNAIEKNSNGSGNDLNGEEEKSSEAITKAEETINQAEEEDIEAQEEEEEEDNEHEQEDEDQDQEELTEEQKLVKEKEAELELEKQKQRKEAIQYLTEIEIDFAKLRDRLYEDKMSRFKSELEMCLNGSHPELQNVYSKINSHTEEKIRLASLNQKYKFESIDRKTKAERTSIHQQFYKQVSDFRSSYLKDITKEWYQINKERRLLDTIVPEYSYRVPEYVDELVEQRSQVNQEVSILMGLNKYFGFPKAPNLKPTEGEELDNDLKAMNIL